jgi:hypothetical protein
MKVKIVLLFLLASFHYQAQNGGKSSFPLLNFNFSARLAGIGGYSNSSRDFDASQGIVNPSLINSTMAGYYSINQGLLASGINFGQLATVIPLKKGFLLPSIRYINYGEFKGTDATGYLTNNFSAFEYVAGAGYGYQLNPSFSIGINVNVIGSHLETYSSFGLSSNFGASYSSENKLFSLSILAKNIGYQLKSYVSANRSSLPIDIQMSTSIKLKHAPFRFSIIAHHLNEWDITYFDPTIAPSIDGLTGETILNTGAGFGEILARHFAYQIELITTGFLQLRVGFDYNRRQELKLEEQPGMSGFSLGLGLKFKRINIDYGFNIYSKAGFCNTLGISSKLSDWKKVR